ncbi:hypothetical protein KY331_05630 [Candidatus Woesearchaeota archaeon]|nr:hypothetical protein [Candidatus Woesearchaeota archaeon]
MTIIGFNFIKMNVEKKPKAAAGKINISNNISITNVEEKELALGKAKQKALIFTFKFVSKYEPAIGGIELLGNITFVADPTKITEITNSWKKDKKIPKEIMTAIINTALNKSNIQALILSRDINLPPPIPLPKVKQKVK